MTHTVELSSILSASKNQVSANLSLDDSGPVVILGLTEGMYFELNEVGARIWQLIQQPRSVQSLRDTLLDEYDVQIEQCEKDLLTLAGELVERGLAVVVDEPA
jgi:hypothetical protein